MDTNDTWRAFCEFAKHPYQPSDFIEPWDIITHKPKPKQTRALSACFIARASVIRRLPLGAQEARR
jgi:hypothetical protein